MRRAAAVILASLSALCAGCLDFTVGNPCLDGSDCRHGSICEARFCVAHGAEVSVSISPDPAATFVLAPLQLKATVTGTTEQAVKWSSLGQGFLLTAEGLFTPLGPGAFPVAVTSVADPASSAQIVVTVPTPAIDFSPAAVTLPLGATQQFAARLTNTATPDLSWSVSSPDGSVGTFVDGSGLLTAAGAGEFTVVATSRSIRSLSASASVIVQLPVSVRFVAEPQSTDTNTRLSPVGVQVSRNDGAPEVEPLQVTLTVTGPGRCTLQGSTASTSGGLATFSSALIPNACPPGSYRLHARVGGVTADSAPFTVSCVAGTGRGAPLTGTLSGVSYFAVALHERLSNAFGQFGNGPFSMGFLLPGAAYELYFEDPGVQKFCTLTNGAGVMGCGSPGDIVVTCRY